MKAENRFCLKYHVKTFWPYNGTNGNKLILKLSKTNVIQRLYDEKSTEL